MTTTTTGVSPLAPKRFPDLPPVRGLRLATGAAEIRYKGRDDLLLVELAAGTTVAGCFTRSATAAAPVLWCRQALAGGRPAASSSTPATPTPSPAPRASGRCSRRPSPPPGCSAARRRRSSSPRPASSASRCRPTRSSRMLPRLYDELGAGGWARRRAGDRHHRHLPQGRSRTAEIDGRPVGINGIAKGAGMIAPDMATMLAFVFTDAGDRAGGACSALLDGGVARSFNCITVDGDTSTNDTAAAFATGAAGNAPIADADDPRVEAFRAALDAVLLDLAHPGRRATARARPSSSPSPSPAPTATPPPGRSRSRIANSPLVKTAIAGEDANWGRIVMAVGKAGERIDRDRLAIRIGGVAGRRRTAAGRPATTRRRSPRT